MKWIVPFLLLAACKSDPPPAEAPTPPPEPPAKLQLSSLSVQDVTPADRRPVPLDEAALRDALERELAQAGLTRGKDKSHWRVGVDARVVYGVALDDGIAKAVQAGPLRFAWEVEVRLRPPNEPALKEFVQSTGSAAFEGADAAALKAALEAQLAASAKDTAEQVVAGAEAFSAGPAALLERLDHTDRARRLTAATRLGILRHADAVPKLIERLEKEPDRWVKLRIVGALTEIADPRATDPLIAQADPRDRELLSGVVVALSAIGGERANDFLDILSSHDAPDIREMVRAARARMKRKADR